MADIFGKEPLELKQPITADKCIISLDGKVVAEASQISIEYSQSITRRRSIGNKTAVIYGAQPQGRASIARLLALDMEDERGKSWTGCVEGTLTFSMGGGCGGQDKSASKRYTATGCIVSAFSIQASADDLTVMDNVVIEFMELKLA